MCLQVIQHKKEKQKVPSKKIFGGRRKKRDTKQDVISDVSFDFIYKPFYNYLFIIHTVF